MTDNNESVRGRAVAWMRFHGDGGYEGPIADRECDETRKRSGVWEPLVLQSDLAAAIARAEAAERDARRWQHVKDVMTHSYGDGCTEPVEYCLHLEWQQGSWLRDGSNGGRGRPDTFPGWDFIVDEMIGQRERELAELEGDASIDAAIAAQQAEGEDRG